MTEPERKIRHMDLQEIHTSESSKTTGSSDRTPLLAWMKLINARSVDEVNAVAEEYPQMKKAADKLLELNQDENARMLYEARLKEERDNRARENAAKEQGLNLGISQGISIGIERVAQNMLKHNWPVEDIM